MKALVLAAGRGERLRPLTDATPKPLLEIGGRRLIEYPIGMLRRAGISEIAINVHHLADQFELALRDGRKLGVELTYSPEPTLLGTGGPLLVLRSFFGNQPFVVANADTILDLDLRAMIEFHRVRSPLVTIALYRPPRLEGYSRIEVDAESMIRRVRLMAGGGFRDFPAEVDAGVAAGLQSMMFCGVYICEPAVFELMPRAQPFSSFGDVFAPMVARTMPLMGWTHRGMFHTLDDLQSYQWLRREVAANPGLLAGCL